MRCPNQNILNKLTKFHTAAKSIILPQGMYVAWSKGNKEQTYGVDRILAYHLIRHALNAKDLMEHTYEDLSDQLFSFILSQKPNAKSVFYVRSDCRFSQFDDPKVCYTTLNASIIGAWDKPGIIKNPHSRTYEKIIGKVFRKKYHKKPHPKRILLLPDIITVRGSRHKHRTGHQHDYWALDSEKNVTHVTRYILRKYYFRDKWSP